MKIEEQVLLAPLTTFGIGGNARFFVHVESLDALREAVAFAKEKNLKTFILGGGSNVLIDDKGFDGLVIKIEMRGIELKPRGDKVELSAQAGESWDVLVARAVEEHLWGLENLSGIPGTVGGAIVQNVGAYGAAVSQTLSSVEVFDTENGEVKILLPTECALGYRDSLFKHDDGQHVILRAVFLLSSTPAPEILYRDLANRFANTTPTLEAIRAVVLEIRRGKFPDLTVEGTAGSFFKNPIVSQDEAKILLARYPDMPLFPMPETAGTKVPLGWILDHILNVRGMRQGRARLFERQALVIVADKKASSKDVQSLAEIVQSRMKNECGIDIEPEVRIISGS